VIICNLVGGLGNQIFQYACARALALNSGQRLKFCTDTFNSYNDHNGFEIAEVFGLDVDFASRDDLSQMIGWGRSFPVVRRLMAKRPLACLAGRYILTERHARDWSALLKRAQLGGYLHGYWQSQRFFSNQAEQIRADLSFCGELHGANLGIAHAITQCTSISVHVRRGDYVNNAKTSAMHGACSLEYYHNAIGMLLKRCPGARLFAFSDDPVWVSQMLKPYFPGMVLVDHNKGKDSYKDMWLMSLCHHHIIANSSFSWWAAWLTPCRDKIVIAPRRWFANGADSQDLIPDSWMSI